MYLNTHTQYSLRYGTWSVPEIIAFAKANHIKKIALTDINNTSACLSFVRKAQEANIQAVLGIDFRNGIQQEFVAIAQNNQGFLEINHFLSKHLHDKTPIPEKAPTFAHSYVIYPFHKVAQWPYRLDNHEYIGVRIRDLSKLSFLKLSKDQHSKIVLLEPMTFGSKKEYNIHRLLRAIAENTLLSKLPKNAQASAQDIFKTPQELAQALLHFPEIKATTQALLDSCHIHFNFAKTKPHQNLKHLLDSIACDYSKLRKLCKQGLPERYPNGITYAIKRRVIKELQLIQQQHFVAFFLINWKIIEYARSKDYYYVGRGSGANSIVAYLLRITDVDPIELDLYFERFMNLYRSTPPDFDIDFSTWDREDVTRFIFDEFGKQSQVALLGAYVTFKHSGAVRELGKVFGLPKHEIDKLSDGKYNPNELDDISKLVLTYASYFNGRPNYLSIHAAGILIAEQPIHYFSATSFPPKGFPTVQFDMHIAEDVGLYKFDILGQRGLGKIKDAVGIIKENHPGVQLPDIHHTRPFFKDPKINAMIARAECIGCFYVESPAMRMLLKKLAVNDYLTLVAASSIIRPGVAKSGMMREYILRHKNPERAQQVGHPVLLDIMPDTYGVMVYQEDVIKVAHHYAHLDLGEADVLRRGMSGKYRSRAEFLQVKEKFKQNCFARGENPKIVNEVWRQIESFAGYAFAKGHSASYAVESYQSLYLKCYYPLEYMVATINNGGGFYRVETYLHEARLQGASIHPPCVNRSQIQTIIQGKDIILGFQHLHGLEKSTMIALLNARNHMGVFHSLDKFIERVSISIEQLDILIRIDAFRSTQKDKRTLLWEAYYKEHAIPDNLAQQQLFSLAIQDFTLPTFDITALECAFDQLELLGFPLCDSFILLEKPPSTALLASELRQYLNKIVRIYGYLITAKRTRTTRGNRMFFGTFLDQAGRWIDTVHFPPVAQRYPFKSKGIYCITGKVVSEFDFLTIEVSKLERMGYVPDPRFDPTYNRKVRKEKKDDYGNLFLLNKEKN